MAAYEDARGPNDNMQCVASCGPGGQVRATVEQIRPQVRRSFLTWNPGAKEDCEMLIADYWVCVGVQRQVGNTDLEWETAQP